MSNLQYQDSTAWMVRRDCSIFPIVRHIYGNPSEIEETLFAAEWLYEHTAFEKTRREIDAFARIWASQFVDKKDCLDEAADIKECCRNVAWDLNEEFMRVRFGGMYHTAPASRELYFRISSENYNWSQVIMEFINKSQLDYSEFFVVIDEEAAEMNPDILKQSRLLRMK